MYRSARNFDHELMSFIDYYQTLKVKHTTPGALSQSYITAQSLPDVYEATTEKCTRTVEERSVESLYDGDISDRYSFKEYAGTLDQEEKAVFYLGEEESDFLEDDNEDIYIDEREKEQDDEMAESSANLEQYTKFSLEDVLPTQDVRKTCSLKHSSTTDLSKYFTKIPEQKPEPDYLVWTRWKAALLDDTDDTIITEHRPRRQKSELEQRINRQINNSFVRRDNSVSMPNISSVQIEDTELSTNIEPSSTDNIPDSTTSPWAMFSNRVKSSMSSSMSLFSSLWSLDETNSQESQVEEDEEEFRTRVASAPYTRERRRSMFSISTSRNNIVPGHTRSYSACNSQNTGISSSRNESDANCDRNAVGELRENRSRKRFESAPNVAQMTRKKSWYDLILQE